MWWFFLVLHFFKNYDSIEILFCRMTYYHSNQNWMKVFWAISLHHIIRITIKSMVFLTPFQRWAEWNAIQILNLKGFFLFIKSGLMDYGLCDEGPNSVGRNGWIFIYDTIGYWYAQLQWYSIRNNSRPFPHPTIQRLPWTLNKHFWCFWSKWCWV